jgi:hypothetical protein
MRHVKMMLCAGVALGALFIATPALAGEFIATRNPNPCSEAEPCPTNGKGIGTADENHPGWSQEFQFGAFNVLCKKARPYAKTAEEGAPTWTHSESFTTQVVFSECYTVAHFTGFEGGIKTRVSKMQFTYLPNAEGKGGEPGQVLISEGSVKIGSGICTFRWGGQTIYSKPEKPAATFATTVQAVKVSAKFPTGLRESLVINNSFRGIEWEYEAGQCVGEKGFEEEATKTEGKSANYFGSLSTTVVGGSLGYLP